MYPNIRAEMARLRLTNGKLAKILGCTPATLSLKMHGKANITLNEARKIKEVLETDMTIEELFEPEEECS